MLKYLIAYYIEEDLGWCQELQRGFSNWNDSRYIAWQIHKYNCPLNPVRIETEEDALNYLNKAIKNRRLECNMKGNDFNGYKRTK